MFDQLFIPAAQLGGTVFTVVAFLWFLSRLLNNINATQVQRDKESIIASNRQAESNITLAIALEKLSNSVTSNTATNVKNTEVIKENVSAVKETAGAIKENTETIKKTTNGNGGEVKYMDTTAKNKAQYDELKKKPNLSPEEQAVVDAHDGVDKARTAGTGVDEANKTLEDAQKALADKPATV